MDPKFFMVFFFIIMGLFLALCIASAMRTKRAYKLFEAESLKEHLDDDLNIKQYRENKRNISAYFYEKMTDYARETTLTRFPKREAYDNKSRFVPAAQSFLDQERQNLLIIFSNGNDKFNNSYKTFINDYRPWYTVGDFYKTITEYITFISNPSAFQKVVVDKEPDEQETQAEKKDEVSDTPTEDGIVDIYDDYAEQFVPFSSNVIVDSSITKPLLDYAVKLAKKRCDDKKVVCFDVSGNKTQQYEAKCKAAYNQLSKLFTDGRLLNGNFLQWVLSEHPDYSINQFDKLIVPYIKYIKSK